MASGGVYCDDSGTHKIGVMHPYYGDVTIAEIPHWIADNESKYDAQLISKAPEMLEMLIYMTTDEDMRANLRLNSFSLLHDVEQLIKEATEI